MDRPKHQTNGETPKEKQMLMNNDDNKKKNSIVKIPDVEMARSGRNLTWWKQRTFLEKALFWLSVIMCLIVVMLLVVMATRSGRPLDADNGHLALVTNHQTEVCTTSHCVQTASRLLNAMDTSIKPCEDFFEYACGAWNKKNVIPDDRSYYNTFGKLRDELQVILKSLLEEEVKTDEPTAIQHTKNLYKSCLDMPHIEERGDAPLFTLLKWLGQWPILYDNWDDSGFDWIELMAKLRLLNNRVLINQWVSADDKNSMVNIIQLDQTHLGMPSRDYYLKGSDDPVLIAYKQFAVDVAILLGAPKERAQQHIAEMIDFEIKLANTTMPDELRRDTESIYHKYTVEELYSNITRDIDWMRYLNLVFANVSNTISMTEPIVVYTPEYLKNLAKLVQETPKRVVANYMMWRIVQNRVKNLPQTYLNTRLKYNKVLYGTDSERARWRTCVTYVNDNFGMALGRMFVSEHLDEKSKHTAEEMIHNIRESFSELLEEVDWMDKATRAKAREKANMIQEKIGFPAYIMNDTLLNQDYEGIVIDPKKYFENILSNLNTVTRYNLKNLGQPVDRSRWSTTPAIVNAFYSAAKNQIMFPAGILQPPFYSEHYPKSMNFGGISMVIGHEITHGFDDKGRQFDKDGNLQQWWSDSVIEKFKDRAQCIIEQYSNFTVPEVNLKINGRQTQGENIADNGGLKQSFRAYRKWVGRQGHEEPLLPGIHLSHNQLFFLNFAQIWCGTARPESYIQAIRSGRHSPGRFRVIGSLSNSYEFAKAFSCPVGSPMNPKHKCSVW